MKTATIPAVRVELELRAEIEALLGKGETVAEFVEASIRATVLRRRHQARARTTGDYVDADDVVKTLQRRLNAALEPGA